MAIKKLRVSLSVSEQQEVFEDLIKECTLLSTLDHPNILTFIGLSVKAPNFAIVTEFMSRCAKLLTVQIELTFSQGFVVEHFTPT